VSASPSPLSISVRKQLSDEFALDVSFSAEPGVTMLFGPSGAGKTTLLDCIAGLLTPDGGRIASGARALFDSAGGINVPTRRRRIAYLFQTLALFPHLTAAENIGYGLRGLPSAERRARIDAILESFRIAHLRGRRPGAISGGERQRVALARALVTDPGALLLDEPLSALDLATRHAIIDDLRAWNAAHSIPVLYVTHSRDEVFALGEHVVAIEQGRMFAEGAPHDLLTSPRYETLAQAAGIENILDGTVTALHDSSGTMTCRVGRGTDLEVPLGRFEPGDRVRIGIRAGDILLATAPPVKISARNRLPGAIVTLKRHDFTIVAEVDCGAVLAVHLTPAAVRSLELEPGTPVWLVIKTHSCHLLSGS
jgi:molybdate transport system ATP-binding protein